MLTWQGNLAEAELFFERSQALREKVLGPESMTVANSIENRAELSKIQVRTVEC